MSRDLEANYRERGRGDSGIVAIIAACITIMVCAALVTECARHEADVCLKTGSKVCPPRYADKDDR